MARNYQDISAYCEGCYKAGESGYTAPLKRGRFEVTYDSKRWVYNLTGTGFTKRDIRHFIALAWDCNASVRVTGRYPHYSVEVTP